MAFIITRNSQGTEISKKERSRGRPPVTNDLQTVTKEGEDTIITLKDVAVASVGIPETPKTPVFIIYRNPDGTEISRKQYTRGRISGSAIQEGTNWVIVVTPEETQAAVDAAAPKPPVFIIKRKADGTEVSRKQYTRGRIASSAIKEGDNWVVIVGDEVEDTTPDAPVAPEAIVSPVFTEVPTTETQVETKIEVIEETPAGEEIEGMTSGEIIKAKQQILEDNNNSDNWNYDFKNLIEASNCQKIDAQKQYTLEDVRACVRDVMSLTTDDGKVVMYGAFIAGNLIDDADWTNVKGTDGWRQNSVYSKMIVDIKENAILVWKINRDGKPDFIIRNVLSSTATPVVPTPVEEPGVVSQEEPSKI